MWLYLLIQRFVGVSLLIDSEVCWCWRLVGMALLIDSKAGCYGSIRQFRCWLVWLYSSIQRLDSVAMLVDLEVG